MKRSLVSTFLVLVALSFTASAQTTVLTYDGSLNVGGIPANGSFDLRFILYTTAGGAVQTGNAIELFSTTVTNGVYSADLDFGTMPFTTQPELWVEVGYRTAGSGSAYTSSGPRHSLRPSAYALRAHYATTAGFAQTADSVGGLYPNNIVQNNTSGSPQPGVTVNVGGDVSGFNVNAANGYYQGFQRLMVTEYENLYTGFNSGQNSGSTFLGNSFYGTNSGRANKFGSQNSFFGYNAGQQNDSSFNSFFGYFAGAYNTTGTSNAFFGAGAGNLNEVGTDNTFIGRISGQNNSKGVANTFLGSNAGVPNTTGSHNTFIGFNTGLGASSQRENTLIGARANVASKVNNGTAIGNYAMVERSDSVVIGSINGVNGAKTSSNVGIGTTSPASKLEVVDSGKTGIRVQTNTPGGTVASFGPTGAFQIDAPGVVGGRLNVAETGNVGIGTASPTSRLHVNGNVRITGGDLIVPYPFGIVLQDSSGNCYRLRINQSGQVVVSGLFCP